MKLFTKYNRINLSVLGLIFVISSIAFYFFIDFFLVGEIDEEVRGVKRQITNYVAKNNRLPVHDSLGDMRISYSAIPHPNADNKVELLKEYDATKDRVRKYRMVTFYVSAQNKWFEIKVSKQLDRNIALKQIIVVTTLVTLLMILVVNLLINIFVLQKIWQPFYDTLDALRHFSLSSENKLSLPMTDIDEFILMNKSLSESTLKAQTDYQLLKEFTENASHEIQTPLAIVRSKLDMLIQDVNLSQNQSHLVESAYRSIKKLSSLNKSLLLLTKISNHQFQNKSRINLELKINEKIKQFEDIWQDNNFSIITHMQPVHAEFNEDLLDILLNNLFNNATRHNIKNGKIIIDLKPKSLSVSNSGENQSLDNQKVFSRFYKKSQKKDSTGLGLSIIKQICDASDIKIAYTFENKFHIFKLTW